MPVALDIADGIAHVTLDRYEKRNALDAKMLASLDDALAAVTQSTEVQVVLLRGSGGFFCAGADLTEWADPGPEEADRLSRLGTATLNRIAALPVPSVAAVERSALGGGLELALACDVRITTNDTLFGYPEATLGNLTSWGGIARVVDTVGLAHARRLFMTGRPISGADAERIGLVTRAVPIEHLQRAIDETVSDILSCDPLALRVLKDALSVFQRQQPMESAMAAFFSLSETSRSRKQAFLHRPRPTTKEPS
jgi:enoyl-CoA hydratase/carnithine racemase